MYYQRLEMGLICNSNWYLIRSNVACNHANFTTNLWYSRFTRWLIRVSSYKLNNSTCNLPFKSWYSQFFITKTYFFFLLIWHSRKTIIIWCYLEQFVCVIERNIYPIFTVSLHIRWSWLTKMSHQEIWMQSKVIV